ncbi:FliH/SctL family protein [Arenimonas sp.]|uniref:FliH/SctL family protein n=1 Tax=Arenimonas sp. TaxID=1872635 RepID=UPI0039E7139B
MRRLSPEQLQPAMRPVRLGASEETAPASAAATDDSAARLQAAFDEARDRGFDEGMKDAAKELQRRSDRTAQELRDAQAKAMAELEGKQKSLQALLAGLPQALNRHADDCETLAVEVGFAALARLLGDLDADRELMTRLCRAVLRDFGQPSARLRLSEADLPMIDVTALAVAIEPDRRLAPGACVIETPRGQIDSGLDVRLEAIQQGLLQALSEHRSRA